MVATALKTLSMEQKNTIVWQIKSMKERVLDMF